jgi:hypothetical protein
MANTDNGQATECRMQDMLGKWQGLVAVSSRNHYTVFRPHKRTIILYHCLLAERDQSMDA